MAVLVTGATGFLGRHVLQVLRRASAEEPIVVLVRNKSEWNRLGWTQELPHITLLEGSVTDSESWQDAPELHNLQGIFHLAALVRHSRQHAAEVFQVNIEGTQSMVRLAAHYACRVVFVSTSGTVGCFASAAQHANEDAPYCEDTVATWPYYLSKIRAEQSARALADKLQVSLVVMRPPVLLGPGDHRFRSTGHVISFMRRRLPFLISGGIHYVDIRDVAQAIVAAMRHPQPQHAYNLQGTACTIEQFFGTLQDITGIAPPRLHLPFALAHKLAKACEWVGIRVRGERLHLLPDPVVVEMAAKYWDVRSLHAARDLQFNARDGRETLQDTVAWLQQHHTELRATCAD